VNEEECGCLDYFAGFGDRRLQRRRARCDATVDGQGAAAKAVTPDWFIVARSGTNLPITEKLEKLIRKNGDLHRSVKSIGSDGAIKGVQDGMLKLDMISQPLTEAEKAAELKTIPYAMVGVVRRSTFLCKKEM